MPQSPFFMDFGAIFCQKAQILTESQLFVYKKFIKFIELFLKKLLHFLALYSIIVMLRGEKSHRSV